MAPRNIWPPSSKLMTMINRLRIKPDSSTRFIAKAHLINRTTRKKINKDKSTDQNRIISLGGLKNQIYIFTINTTQSFDL